MGAVLVFGNEKGGSGKTTVAFHTAIYMAYEGLKVGCVDLDIRQQSFSRYAENRTSYVNRNNTKLPGIYVIPYPESKKHDSDYINDTILTMKGKFDLVIVDTPGSSTASSSAAHGQADIVITPINDSFIDMDLLGQVQNDDCNQITPGIYSQVVWSQKLKKAKQDGKEIDWIVLRNRMSNIEARNKQNVERTLGILAKKFGFRICSGFSERVVFRELFTKGLTLLDIMKTDEKPTASHLAARQELRSMINELGVLCHG